ncbi:MAG: transglutaminase domain-containing protein [Gemmiger sp.]
MKQLEYRFTTELEFSAPVVEHVFTLRCLPVEDGAQRVLQAEHSMTPACRTARLEDGFGNVTLCGSLMPPHDRFFYGSAGTVQVDLTGRGRETPSPALRYPGALTAPDGALRAFLAGLPLEGQAPRRQCELLSAAVNGHFAYVPGATGPATTAAQAFAGRQGVCQDYAQTLAVLARLAGYPARYCMGLAVGEGATHAWTEIFLPELGWMGWDPTRSCEAGEGYLRFGTGRDAADCPVERGVFRGAAGQTQRVFMACREK